MGTDLTKFYWDPPKNDPWFLARLEIAEATCDLGVALICTFVLAYLNIG